MSDCRIYQSLIDWEEDESLSFTESSSLELHLRGCLECRQYKGAASIFSADLNRAMVMSPELDLAPLLIKRLELDSWKKFLALAGLISAILILLVINSATMLTGILSNPLITSLVRILSGPMGQAAVTLGRVGGNTLAVLPGHFWIGLGLIFMFNKIILLKLLGIPLLKGR